MLEWHPVFCRSGCIAADEETVILEGASFHRFVMLELQDVPGACISEQGHGSSRGVAVMPGMTSRFAFSLVSAHCREAIRAESGEMG